jgi:hypothetical protein
MSHPVIGQRGLLFCFVAVLLAVLVGVWIWEEFQGATVSRTERWVSAALPPGSTREQVDRWLDDRHVDHWDNATIVHADTSNGITSLVWPSCIVIEFSFDSDGKLVRHTIKAEFDGP